MHTQPEQENKKNPLPLPGTPSPYLVVQDVVLLVVVEEHPLKRGDGTEPQRPRLRLPGVAVVGREAQLAWVVQPELGGQGLSHLHVCERRGREEEREGVCERE